MNQEAWKIKSFTDLNVWKEAYSLILLIYNVTKDFPKEDLEKFKETLSEITL